MRGNAADTPEEAEPPKFSEPPVETPTVGASPVGGAPPAGGAADVACSELSDELGLSEAERNIWLDELEYQQ